MEETSESPRKPRTRILNLDDFLPPELGIRYKGVYHTVLPVNTENWLRMLQKNQELIRHVQKRKKNGDQPVDVLESQEQEMIGTINMLCEVCPTLPREDLMAMPLIALQKFSEMVMNAMNDTMEEPTGDAPGELTSSVSLAR